MVRKKKTIDDGVLRDMLNSIRSEVRQIMDEYEDSLVSSVHGDASLTVHVHLHIEPPQGGTEDE